MAKIVVTYKTPRDTKAFDSYYFSTHVPLAKTIPGLKKYDVSIGDVASPTGPSGYHLVATLYFDNRAAVDAAFASPEGRAAAADIGNFADGGVEIIFFETKDV